FINEDSNKDKVRMLVKYQDRIVACFSILRNYVLDIAYEKNEKGIDNQLLSFLVTQWIKFVVKIFDQSTKKIFVLFPSYDYHILDQYGFVYAYSRDQKKLDLTNWSPLEVNTDFQIRQARLEDSIECGEVRVDAYEGSIDVQLFSPQGVKLEEEIEDITTFLSVGNKEFPIIKYATLVAINEDGNIVGFCLTSMWRDKPFIYDLAVANKYKGKQIGKALINKSLTTLKNEGQEEITLFVTRGNTRAENLYKSFGFKLEECSLVVLKKILS
ncbi:MAG: GNAT family N-acetyltransferase, partial [Candidatus Hodarchaeales archaeon]